MSAGLIVGAFFIGIAAILVLITLHEFGHFLIAKLCNAYVYEFSIGYGPRLWTHKGKETWFSIRLFPLGGFCSIASDRAEPPKGREEDAENIPDDRKMDYIARWKKAMFILGGPAMNFAIAIIMISIILMACLKLPQDMTFNGNALNKDKIAYQLIDNDMKTNKDKYHFDDATIKAFEDNTQRVSITGWEVIQTKESDISTYDKMTTAEIYKADFKDGKEQTNGVKFIYSNLINDGWADQWKNDKSFQYFTQYIKDNFKHGSIVDTNASKAPDYSTIVYNFLDNFKSERMIEDTTNKDFHSFLRLSYRIMNKNLYTGEYQDAKDYVTGFSDNYLTDINNPKSKELFKLNKKNTTQVGVNPPSRYFKNTTKAYAYSWHVMGQDSVSILRAFGMLFTGHINALSGPVGVAQQTATLIKAPETFFLYMAGLSANLMVLNLIPIPPLDGYKFCENIVEAALRREIKQKTKYWLYGIGIACFLIVYIVVIIHDFVG